MVGSDRSDMWPRLEARTRRACTSITDVVRLLDFLFFLQLRILVSRATTWASNLLCPCRDSGDIITKKKEQTKHK